MRTKLQLQSAIQAGITRSVRRPRFSASSDGLSWTVYNDDAGDCVASVWHAANDVMDEGAGALAHAIADALNAVCAGTVPTVGQDALDAARAMEAER